MEGLNDLPGHIVFQLFLLLTLYSSNGGKKQINVLRRKVFFLLFAYKNGTCFVHSVACVSALLWWHDTGW